MHKIALCCIALYDVAQCHVTLRCIRLRQVTLGLATLPYVTLHCLSVRYITFQKLHYVTYFCFKMYIIIHYFINCITLRNITLLHVYIPDVTVLTIRIVVSSEQNRFEADRGVDVSGLETQVRLPDDRRPDWRRKSGYLTSDVRTGDASPAT